MLFRSIEKIAEAPIEARKQLGDELFDKVLEATPTEKLQEGLDFLIDKNSDDPNVKELDKIINMGSPLLARGREVILAHLRARRVVIPKKH